MQFTCENGRIILCLKHQEWNRSAVSSMFRQISSSGDFVDKWNSEVVTTTESSISDSDSSTRKRTSTMSLDSSPIPSTSDDSVSHPPAAKKRCNYVSQGLDERIEKVMMNMNVVLK